MGILADVIKLKAFEDAKQQRDIQAISSSVTTFLNAKNQAMQQQRQIAQDQRQISIDALNRRKIESDLARQPGIDALNRRNVESQIEARKKSALELSVENADQFSTLQEAAKGGSVQARDTLKKMLAAQGQGQPATSPSVQDFVPETQQVQPGQVTQAAQTADPDVDQENFSKNESQLFQRAKAIDPLTGELTADADQAASQLKVLEESKKKLQSNNAAVALQELKKGAEIRRNLNSGDIKLDITMREWLDFLDQQMDIFGEELGKPGPISGLLANTLGKVSPDMRNEFFKSFQGTTIELAAFIGRNAMPGTRAARIIDLFRETAPDEFDTLFGGINNSAASWAETIATDFGNHSAEYLGISEQEWENMSLSDKSAARNNVMKPYAAAQQKLFKETYILQAYEKNQKLFSEKELKEAEAIVRRQVREGAL